MLCEREPNWSRGDSRHAETHGMGPANVVLAEVIPSGPSAGILVARFHAGIRPEGVGRDLRGDALNVA